MDPYSTLGIPRESTQEEIKKAYRRLAMEFHPDRNDKPEAEEQFKRVSEAYSMIGTEENRKEYHAAQSRPRHSGNPFDDFFRSSGQSWEDIFGSPSRRARPPYVIRAQIEVSLEELASETVRTFTLDGQTIDFRVPKGIRPNETVAIKLRQGQELHLSVSVSKHQIFDLRGDDLYGKVIVPVETAIKGGEVRVPTLDGNINLVIPPRTNSHSKLRVRASGLPKRSGGSGSIIYEVVINVKKLGHSLSEWTKKA